MSSVLPSDVSRANLETGGEAIQTMRRIQAEYAEMPGLCLTPEQAARLLGLDHRDCSFLLGGLVVSGFLRLTPVGYVRA